MEELDALVLMAWIGFFFGMLFGALIYAFFRD